MHRLEEVAETVIQPKFIDFFTSDATAGYWAVPMRRGDEYKTGLVTPHGHYTYLRMGMGLKGASQTYARFGDLTFGYLPPTDGEPEQPTLLKDHGDAGFSIFADDHVGAATSFESMFTFLHTKYFPRCAFGPIYLVPRKTFVFVGELDFMGFTGSAEGLRPSMRHREQIRLWPTPANREEVEGFFYQLHGQEGELKGLRDQSGTASLREPPAAGDIRETIRQAGEKPIEEARASHPLDDTDLTETSTSGAEDEPGKKTKPPVPYAELLAYTRRVDGLLTTALQLARDMATDRGKQ